MWLRRLFFGETAKNTAEKDKKIIDTKSVTTSNPRPQTLEANQQFTSSSSTTSHSQDFSQPKDEAFIHNPKDKQRAKKFEARFGVKYIEGIKTEHPLAIAPIYKLAAHHIPHPFGVMSTAAIQPGAILAEYTGKPVTEEPDDMAYTYRAGKQLLDAQQAGSVGRFFNHSDNNNSRYVTENGRVFIKTIREITPGEQLTVNYGHQYFTTDIDRVYIDAHHTALSFQQLFLQRQADYQPLSKLKNPPLKHAIKQFMNCSDEKRILVPRIEQPNYPVLVFENNQVADNPTEITLFHVLCAEQDDANLIEKALENGADINIQDSNGRNALFYIISNPSISDEQKATTLSHILSNTENHEESPAPFVTDRNFKTVFHYCIENHLNDCLAVLTKYVVFDIAYFDFVVESPLNTAIKSQNMEALKLLMTRYSHVNLQNHLTSKKAVSDLVNCIAELPDQTKRENIYATLAEFINTASLVNKVQKKLLTSNKHPVTRAKASSRTSSYLSSPSLTESSSNTNAASKRKKKPNLYYSSGDFITSDPSKNTPKKRSHAEALKDPDAGSSHTVFSKRQSKHANVNTTQNQPEQSQSAQKKPRK